MSEGTESKTTLEIKGFHRSSKCDLWSPIAEISTVSSYTGDSDGHPIGDISLNVTPAPTGDIDGRIGRITIPGFGPIEGTFEVSKDPKAEFTITLKNCREHR